MQVTIRTHYGVDDPEFDFDYHAIDILDDTGRVIQSYGDWCHDKGRPKVDGFLDAMRHFGLLEGPVTYVNVADSPL